MSEWVPDPKPVDPELEPGFDHADYIPSITQQMMDSSIGARLDNATKQLLMELTHGGISEPGDNND